MAVSRMSTERWEGENSEPSSPSSSGVRSLGLEVVAKLSSLLFGHGQVGGPHGGGVLEHTEETGTRCQVVTKKKAENVTGRDWSEGEVQTSEIKVDSFKDKRLIGFDSHLHLHRVWCCCGRDTAGLHSVVCTSAHTLCGCISDRGTRDGAGLQTNDTSLYFETVALETFVTAENRSRQTADTRTHARCNHLEPMSILHVLIFLQDFLQL